MKREHKHILVPMAKVLLRKEHGLRDEFLYKCDRCAKEFVAVPPYESEVPK